MREILRSRLLAKIMLVLNSFFVVINLHFYHGWLSGLAIGIGLTAVIASIIVLHVSEE